MDTESHPSIVELIQLSGLSQVELARAAGLSRVQVNRIVNGSAATIRPRTRQKLLAVLQPQGCHKLADTVTRYRQSIEERLGSKSFAGLGLPELPDQSLDAIFVPPQVIPHQCRTGSGDDEQFASNVARDSYASAVQEAGPISVDCLITANSRVVLVGCPGAGKTTTLEHLAVRSAREEVLGPHCLPVFIRLPEFAAAREISPSVDFVSWVTSLFGDGGDGELYVTLKSWLMERDKSVLFLFDGLDEVACELERRRLTESIIEFVRRHPANRFCVTSRPIGFDPTPWTEAGFQVHRLIEYGDEQIDLAITKWSRVLANKPSGTANDIGDRLKQAIYENPRVRQIAANPLILTILVFLCKSRGYVLPRRGADLYSKVAEVFLDSWEFAKRTTTGFSETLDIDLDTRELSWLVAHVALEMQRRGLVLAKRWWIEQRLEESLTARIGLDGATVRDVTSRLLRFVSERTGLLEERALGSFAFSHRTLQEYFAAVGVINEADAEGSHALPKLLRPYLFHPDWTEVVRLVASQVTPPRAEELIRVILDDPDPSGRLLHRGPLLAIRCLLDGTTIANRRLIEQVFHSFDDLGTSRWLGITLESLAELRQFKGTRFSTHAEQAIDRILGAARTALDEDEYAALVLAPGALGAKVAVDGLDGVAANQSAVVRLSVSAGNLRRQILVPNFELLDQAPEQWHGSAVAILESPETETAAKETVLRQLGMLARLRHAKFHRRARVRLKHTLRTAVEPRLRGAAARALGGCTFSSQRLLLSVLANDNDVLVRAAAARALADASTVYDSVREHLITCLQSDEEEVQAAAAIALRDAARANQVVAKALWERAEQATSRHVRVACAASLDTRLGCMPELLQQFRRWAFESGEMTQVACLVLADAFAAGRIVSWDADCVRRVEEVLRNIGDPDKQTGQPRPHHWWALRALVDAREARGGIRVDSTLADCLEPFAKRLKWAFIFGSVARNQQIDGSDIDLALIGDLSMSELSPTLGNVERTLGRAVNPVIYTYRSFVERLHAGDPFLTEIVHESKIPVRVGDRPMSLEELERELGAVAAERLADGQTGHLAGNHAIARSRRSRTQ